MKLISSHRLLAVLTIGWLAACSDKQPQTTDETPSTDIVEQVVEGKSMTSPPGEVIAESGSLSDDKAASPTRFAEAHTHGDAELAIVLENGNVVIEFDSPLYNILGFEHAPETEAQKTRVMEAETKLSQGKGLFVFNETAKCERTSDTQKLTLFDSYKTQGASDHNHSDSHTDSHPSHEHHEDVAEPHAPHRDLLLTYAFTCISPSKLSNVRVNLFEFFEELSEIDATYLGPATQRQETLTRANSEMDLSQ